MSYVCIIGAQRSATTWLYRELGEHPDVTPGNPQTGEPKDLLAGRPPWPSPEAIITSDGVMLQKATRYLTEVKPELFDDVTPAGSKVIVIGRDMVDRAWSHYRYSRGEGFETLSFRDAIVREPARLQRFPQCADQWAYVSHSLYPEHVQPWLDTLGPERVFLCRTDELDDDPGGLQAEVMDFLELQPSSKWMLVPDLLVNEGDPMTQLIDSDTMHMQGQLTDWLEDEEERWASMVKQNRLWHQNQ